MGLKVLMIGAYPLEPGTVNGGIESVTSTLVPALAERDDIDSVTVLRFHDGETSAEFRSEGPKVNVLLVRGQRRFAALTQSFMDVRRARRIVSELKPDVVHGQEIGRRGDIAVRCAPNSVVTVHGMVHVESRMAAERSIRDRLRVKLFDDIVRRVLRRAKVVVSISDYDSDELAGLIRGVRLRIENPTAPEFFAEEAAGETPPRLLFAGNLSPLKNPLGLVNAFAEARRAVPDARLALVGAQPDPQYLQSIRDRVHALGLDDCVEITGLVDTARMRREIAESRAVVLFSRQENMPTIIAQAMAAGKPVVASRVGGVAELVSDGETGFLVDSEDEVALSDRLQALLKDQDLCLRMGERAHRAARQRFMPAEVAAKTVEAYRVALAGSTRG
jgi:glycosyltransferase involved in cell wall biosynthesis